MCSEDSIWLVLSCTIADKKMPQKCLIACGIMPSVMV